MKIHNFLLLISFLSTGSIAQRITGTDSKNHAVRTVFDNDILKLKNRTDEYYSFGLFVGYYQGIKEDSKIFNKMFSPFKVHGKFILLSELGLQGYTPQSEEMGLIDRPFAGILTFKSSFINVEIKEYLKLTIEVGVRGPASGGEAVQNSFHKLIGNEEDGGWETQLHNKGLINIYGKWSKSFPLIKYFDVIPEANLALGNNNTYVKANFQARAGWFNGLDNTQFYQTDVGDNSETKDKTEVYLLFQLFGKLSIVDATIRDNETKKNIGVQAFDKKNLIGGYSVQLHVNFQSFGLFYSYIKNSPESNIVPKHSYGSVGVSYLW